MINSNSDSELERLSIALGRGTRQGMTRISFVLPIGKERNGGQANSKLLSINHLTSADLSHQSNSQAPLVLVFVDEDSKDSLSGDATGKKVLMAKHESIKLTCHVHYHHPANAGRGWAGRGELGWGGVRGDFTSPRPHSICI